ncbi:MAG: hypothetical protein MI785_03540 [Kiloniellales bacterium]|nr:hypothetical protein [Kiloniellales bacterium]
MKLRAACLVALLAACSAETGREVTSPAATTGGGAITPSAQVQTAYKRFLGKRHPMVFALSEDGRAAFYRFCFTPGDCEEVRARADALSGCEDNARGIPCRIYYQAPHGVVWDGPPVLGLDGTPATP